MTPERTSKTVSTIDHETGPSINEICPKFEDLVKARIQPDGFINKSDLLPLFVPNPKAVDRGKIKASIVPHLDTRNALATTLNGVFDKWVNSKSEAKRQTLKGEGKPIRVTPEEAADFLLFFYRSNGNRRLCYRYSLDPNP